MVESKSATVRLEFYRKPHDKERQGSKVLAAEVLMTQDCSYNELHALQVLDDSMEPEFPRDCIIVIEPSQACAQGAYVIALISGERWFRQYRRESSGHCRLVALNPDYPDIDLTEGEYQIEGVIVQRNVRRKIKHYQPYQPDNGIPLQ